MRRLMISLMLVLMFLPFVSAFYFTDNSTWNDDFEDGVVNVTLWHNYTYESGVGGASGIARVNETITLGTDGFYYIWAKAVGTGDSGEARAVGRTKIDYNDGKTYRFDFKITSDQATDYCDVMISDGTAISNAQIGTQTGNIEVRRFGDITDVNYTMFINDRTDNATIYYTDTGSYIRQEDLSSLSIWYVQFRASEANTGVTTSWLRVFNFTSREWGIILNSPDDNTYSIVPSQVFNSTINIFNETLTNATIYLWYSNGSVFNSTTNSLSNFETEETTWNISSLPIDSMVWNVYGCGESSCDWSSSNRSFVYGHIVNTNTYTTPTLDMSLEEFILNITIDSNYISFASATLNYNGTSYSADSSGTGDERIFTASVDIPIITSEQKRPFFWELFFSNTVVSSDYNTSSYNQTVSPSNISTCASGDSINFSIWNEQTLTPLSADFDATFTWKLNLSSELSKNNSFDLSAAQSHTFCVNDANRTFYTDMNIEINSSGYTSRKFNFNNYELTNTTKNVRLYLLNESLGTDVIITLKDSGLTPLEDYTITIYRRIESTGEFILVENDITDVFGQIVTNLIENEVNYRFEFYDEDNVLVKTIPNALIVCRATICSVQFVIEDTTDLFADFDDIDNHVSSLLFNSDTNTTTFAWTDNTGQNVKHRLLVERVSFNGTVTLYDQNSSASSGILYYSVGDSRASYRIQAFRIVSGNQQRLHVLNIDVGNIVDTFGLEGLFWSFILLATAILIGIFYPPAGVVLYLGGLFFLSLFDVLFVNPAILIAQVVVGVIFIIAFRG